MQEGTWEIGFSEYLILAIILLCILLWITALVSIIRNEFVSHNEKLLWAILVVFLPFIGTILYFILGVKRIKPQ